LDRGSGCAENLGFSGRRQKKYQFPNKSLISKTGYIFGFAQKFKEKGWSIVNRESSIDENLKALIDSDCLLHD
jgi:hypothetical protein